VASQPTASFASFPAFNPAPIAIPVPTPVRTEAVAEALAPIPAPPSTGAAPSLSRAPTLNRVKSRRPVDLAPLASADLSAQVAALDAALETAPAPVNEIPAPAAVAAAAAATAATAAAAAALNKPSVDRVKSRRLDDFVPTADMSAQIAALQTAPAPAPLPVVVSAVPAPPAAAVSKPGFERVKSRRLDDFAPTADMSAQIAALNTQPAPEAANGDPAPPAAVKKPGFDRVKSRRLDDFAPEGAFVVPAQLSTDSTSSSAELISSPLMGASLSSSSSSSSSSASTVASAKTVASFSFAEMTQRKVGGSAAAATTIEFTFSKKSAASAGTSSGGQRDDGYEPVFVVDSGTATDDMGASDAQNAPLRLATIVSWWSATTAACHACVADSPLYQRVAAACAAVDADMVWLNARGALGFEDDSLLVHDARGWLAWWVAFTVVTLRGIGQVSSSRAVGSSVLAHPLFDSSCVDGFCRKRIHSFTCIWPPRSFRLAQVVFMNSPVSGLLILIALLIQSPFTGLCSLWATGWATWTAWFWSLPRSRFEAGLYGYNGNLVGLGMATFSPVLRHSSLKNWAASLVADHSFDSPTPAAELALSTGDAGLLVLALLMAIAFFSFLSTLMQEALINTVRRHLKVRVTI
jgi:hypothetical protein